MSKPRRDTTRVRDTIYPKGRPETLEYQKRCRARARQAGLPYTVGEQWASIR